MLLRICGQAGLRDYLEMRDQEALLKVNGIGEPGPHSEYLVIGHSSSISKETFFGGATTLDFNKHTNKNSRSEKLIFYFLIKEWIFFYS